MPLYFRMTLQLRIVYGDCILDDVVFSVLYSQLELYSIQVTLEGASIPHSHHSHQP